MGEGILNVVFWVRNLWMSLVPLMSLVNNSATLLLRNSSFFYLTFLHTLLISVIVIFIFTGRGCLLIVFRLTPCDKLQVSPLCQWATCLLEITLNSKERTGHWTLKFLQQLSTLHIVHNPHTTYIHQLPVRVLMLQRSSYWQVCLTVNYGDVEGTWAHSILDRIPTVANFEVKFFAQPL